MITILQVIMIIFALFAWSRAFLRIRDKEISVREFLFWSTIWVTTITVAVYPDVMWAITDLLGIGRAVDVLIYVSILLLFYLMFRVYVNTEKQSQQITKLVRELALKKRKK
jgi:hypothetical protein